MRDVRCLDASIKRAAAAVERTRLEFERAQSELASLRTRRNAAVHAVKQAAVRL